MREMGVLGLGLASFLHGGMASVMLHFRCIA
jgi:hypothetical protein